MEHYQPYTSLGAAEWANLDDIGLVEKDAGNEELPGIPKELLLNETKRGLWRLPQ